MGLLYQSANTALNAGFTCLRKTDLKQSGIAHRPNTRQHSLTSMKQQDKKPEEPVSRTQNKMDHTKL
jgi:hypothetical protein